MKRLLTISSLIITLLLALGFQQKAAAQQQTIKHPDIHVGVNGLSCPFCAYGIEKKMEKIKSIKRLYVNINAGTVDLKLKDGAILSEKRIKKAVKRAGFDTRSITYVNKKAKPKAAAS